MPTSVIAGIIPDLVALGVVAQTAKVTTSGLRVKKKRPSKKTVKKHYGGLADAIVNGRL